VEGRRLCKGDRALVVFGFAFSKSLLPRPCPAVGERHGKARPGFSLDIVVFCFQVRLLFLPCVFSDKAPRSPPGGFFRFPSFPPCVSGFCSAGRIVLRLQTFPSPFASGPRSPRRVSFAIFANSSQPAPRTPGGAARIQDAPRSFPLITLSASVCAIFGQASTRAPILQHSVYFPSRGAPGLKPGCGRSCVDRFSRSFQVPSSVRPRSRGSCGAAGA